MTTLQIDKAMLRVMFSEYWAVDNNPTCAAATRWFLEHIGFTENDIKDVLNNIYEERDIVEILDNIKEMMCYYND